VFMSAFNFVFVDQLLPRSNARLRGLLIDIGRKKPTFELREQVINEVPPSQYFLRAGRIDAATGRLRDITIYDVGGETSRRIIYADSGQMAYAEGQTDLSLRLYDGTIHQYRPSDPTAFQLTSYKVNDIRVKNVFDELVRNSSETVRGDREMSTCEMMTVIQEARSDQRVAAQDREALLEGDLRALLALPALGTAPLDSTDSQPPSYCGWIDRVQSAISPRTDEEANPAQPGSRPISSRQGATVQVPGGAASGQVPAPGQEPAKRVKPRPPLGPKQIPTRPTVRKAPPALNYPRPQPAAGRIQLSNWAQVAAAADRATDADRRADRFLVEVHKKWAISMACISFVIIGLVMALRFPRGGIGLVIGGGLLIFSVHYVGLTAGESLADRGFVSPWQAMWTPNIILTIVGLIGLVRVSRESGSTRGGDFQEVLDGIRHLFRRLRGMPAPPEEAR
jgi:lipopolysaccharide export system permease protein